jgi:4-deoxy-L-threo-5-hexosulose-uronate ketol-isomerase
MRKTYYAIHPEDFKTYDTTRIRENFLITELFLDDTITNHYLHYDRLIVGGAKPVSKPVSLTTFDDLKAAFYLERRELGIINIGPAGSVTVDGTVYELQNKEALYVGMGVKEVVFNTAEKGSAHYYFNSAPAHRSYPTRKVSLAEAETVELGSLETANHRTIRKLLINSVLPTCQLQMGLTELKTGSVWNTMPPHTHDRRMEAYFYFDLPEQHTVCHFLGQPTETRHIWVANRQAVISPPWSIHCGTGTSNYSFIWGMAGENLDYGDMDKVELLGLR